MRLLWFSFKSEVWISSSFQFSYCHLSSAERRNFRHIHLVMIHHNSSSPEDEMKDVSGECINLSWKTTEKQVKHKTAVTSWWETRENLRPHLETRGTSGLLHIHFMINADERVSMHKTRILILSCSFCLFKDLKWWKDIKLQRASQFISVPSPSVLSKLL